MKEPIRVTDVNFRNQNDRKNLRINVKNIIEFKSQFIYQVKLKRPKSEKIKVIL